MAEKILHRYIPEKALDIEGIPVLHFSVQLPLLKEQKRINRYYQAYADAFRHYCEHELLSYAQEAFSAATEHTRSLPQWQAHLSTTITYQDDRILSLYTDSVEQLDGRRLIIRRGDTWDLASGLPLAASDFLSSHPSWRKRLFQTAAQQIRQQEQDGTAQFYPDWRIRLRRYFQPQRFYVTDRDICFFYPMFALASPTEGIPVFRLPCDFFHEKQSSD